MNRDGFAVEANVSASDVREGDLMSSKTGAETDRIWMRVRRVQRLGDGSIRIATEFSDLRMSGSLQVRVMRSSFERAGSWRSKQA